MTTFTTSGSPNLRPPLARATQPPALTSFRVPGERLGNTIKHVATGDVNEDVGLLVLLDSHRVF